MSVVFPCHPLDRPDVVKIALGRLASDALAAVGPHCLVIATMADSTAPAVAQGKMVLLCLPCSKEQLDAAYQVASGQKRAVPIR